MQAADSIVVHDVGPSDKELAMQAEFDARLSAMTASHNEQRERLAERLADKAHEVEQLCVLLEAVAPVPGVDPEKYLRVLEGGEAEADYRDAKVLELAKRCRRMQVQANKSRANEAQSESRIAELIAANSQLKREVDALHAAGVSAPEGPSESDQRELLRRELITAHRQTDDLRKKLFASQEETKRMQRVLLKEVGEGAGEQASEEGWKGRAQQIVMLRAKVKRLEAEAADPSLAQSVGKPSRRRSDVDSKAEQELTGMHEERQRMLDSLVRDKSQLADELERTRDRLEGSKARMQSLTSEVARLKESLRVLIDKTESDDQLIEALREEMSLVRLECARQGERSERSNAETVTRVEFARGADATMNTSTEVELRRMRRQCQQQVHSFIHHCFIHVGLTNVWQASQLSTQDEVIRKLRQQK